MVIAALLLGTCFDTDGAVSADAALARHIEEIVGVELMRQWATAASVKLENGRRNTAPGHVRRAEEIIEAEARDAPTIEEGAHRVSVSASSLSAVSGNSAVFLHVLFSQHNGLKGSWKTMNSCRMA